ncbi:pentapeptide repeat-containing protein [Candidatus Tisiphia endosymbiont of Beris chalybata]|uniref:pentapeptide repeat-containing protein n=1 Tax=Candidatus Tisiphia endosymbiont of Beris chalybata TaxID=3066262 RepID=UPI00312C999A
MTKQNNSVKEIKPQAQLMQDIKKEGSAPSPAPEMENIADRLKIEELIREATKVRDGAWEKLSARDRLGYIDEAKTQNGEYEKLVAKVELLSNQRDQIKHRVEEKEETTSIFSTWTKYIPNLTRSFTPILTSLQEIEKTGKVVFYGYQYWAKNNQSKAANIPADQSKILEAAATTTLLNLIENATIMEHFLPTNKNVEQPIIVRDLVLNFVIPNITNCPNIFAGVEENFVKQLIAISLNLLGVTLKEQELNKKVRGIVEQLRATDDHPVQNIFINSAEILLDPKIRVVVENDLITLLENPNSQKELTKIAANYLGEYNAIPIALLENTIALIANNNSAFLRTVPGFLNIYKAYLEYQKTTVDLSADQNSLDIIKEDVTKLPQALISSVLGNSQEIVNSLAPILKAELPNYLAANQENILDLIKTTAVQKNLLSSTTASLIIEVAPNAIPFVNDFLPLIIELTEECVKEQGKLKDIAEYIQIIMGSTEAERIAKTTELLKFLGEFKDKNPEIKAIIEKKLPDLLGKHAENLGDIVERLLLDSEWGKILHPKGENIIKFLSDIFQEFSEEIADIPALYSQKKYRAMVVALAPLLFPLLKNENFRHLMSEVIVNYCSYLVEKHVTSNITGNKITSEEVNKIIEDNCQVAKGQPKDAEKYDLAEAFKIKGVKSKGTTINLEQVSIYKKLENCKIINFILNKSVFINTSFNNSILQNCSFKGARLARASFVGAVLQDCSFQDVKFTGELNLEGIRIDTKTADTFIPAIREYNHNYPDQKIDLNKITITRKQEGPEIPSLSPTHWQRRANKSSNAPNKVSPTRFRG